jgi:hypothetical protein
LRAQKNGARNRWGAVALLTRQPDCRLPPLAADRASIRPGGGLPAPQRFPFIADFCISVARFDRWSHAPDLDEKVC